MRLLTGLAAAILLTGCQPSREDRLLACMQEADDMEIAHLCRLTFDDRFIEQLAKETAEKARLAEERRAKEEARLAEKWRGWEEKCDTLLDGPDSNFADWMQCTTWGTSEERTTQPTIEPPPAATATGSGQNTKLRK